MEWIIQNMKKYTAGVSTPIHSRPLLVASHEEVAAKAEALWHKRGCPEGRDEEIWLEAEQALSRPRADADLESDIDELDDLYPGGEGPASTSL